MSGATESRHVTAISDHIYRCSPVRARAEDLPRFHGTDERSDGQDTQRAFASARWDLRKLTRGGQQLTFTAYARGDAYHTDDAALTSVAFYRGQDGWHFRGIGALAADVSYPLVGPLLGGTQRLTAPVLP